MQLARGEPVTTGSTQEVGRNAPLIFRQEAEDGRHSANMMSDLSEELSRGARPEATEMDRAALQAELVERVEANHGGGPFSPSRLHRWLDSGIRAVPTARNIRLPHQPSRSSATPSANQPDVHVVVKLVLI